MFGTNQKMTGITEMSGTAEGLVGALLVLVLVTGALIVTRKNLFSLLSAYRLQSLLLAGAALSLYAFGGGVTLLYLALLTIATKVLFIPYFIGRLQAGTNVPRDMTFHYLTPIRAILATLVLMFLVHFSLSRALGWFSDGRLAYMGALLGISLVLEGMLVTFTRKRTMTKIIGYLTMENGVLLFSLFVADIPLIIEVLAVIDLMMIVLLASLLALGMDAGVEGFQESLQRFRRGNRGMPEEDEETEVEE